MTNLQEIWKDIANYEGHYQVSNLGRIKRLQTQYIGGKCRTAILTVPEKILAPVLDAYNYYRVTLCKEGNKRAKRIHVLVAETFIGGRPHGLYANHIDGNKLNNRSDNLEWVTPKENQQHALRLGLRKTGGNCPIARKIISIDKDGNETFYPSITDAAIDLNVHSSNICKCLSGAYHTTGGFRFRNAV